MATVQEAVCCLGEYRRRVLLAHSNEDYLKDLSDALVRAGFDVVLAPDVATAMQYLLRYSFDVCIVEYVLSDTTAGPQAGGENVVRQFAKISHESYKTAWVLIAKEDDEVRAFRSAYNAYSHAPGPVPIINITSVAKVDPPSTQDVSPWDVIATNLIDFIAKKVNFFWNMPIALKADADDVRRTLESIYEIGRKRRYGDAAHSGREMLGEALRLAIPKHSVEDPLPPIAHARLLRDQGYAGTVLAMSLPGPGMAQRLVKVASAEEGAREVDNFHRYVEHRNFSFQTQLLHQAHTIRGDLCVILYSYHAQFDRLTTRLRDVSSIDSSAALIRSLFNELGRAWYSHGKFNVQTPAKMIRAWNKNRDNPLLNPENLRRLWEKAFPRQRRRQPFDWVGDGERRSVNVETVPPLVELIGRYESQCRDWLAITHGDLHSMNVLVSPQSEMISLADFSEIQQEGSVLQDIAQFETHLVLDVLSPSDDATDEHERRLIDALYGTLPAFALSRDSFDNLQLHAAYRYVSEVRKSVEFLRIADNPAFAEEFSVCYGLALLSQFIRRWQYLEEWRYTDKVRWRTLCCTDRIARSLLAALSDRI